MTNVIIVLTMTTTPTITMMDTTMDITMSLVIFITTFFSPTILIIPMMIDDTDEVILCPDIVTSEPTVTIE